MTRIVFNEAITLFHITRDTQSELITDGIVNETLPSHGIEGRVTDFGAATDTFQIWLIRVKIHGAGKSVTTIQRTLGSHEEFESFNVEKRGGLL